MKEKDYFEKASEEFNKLIDEVIVIDKDLSFSDDEISNIDSFMARHQEELEDKCDKREEASFDLLLKKLKDEGKI